MFLQRCALRCILNTCIELGSSVFRAISILSGRGSRGTLQQNVLLLPVVEDQFAHVPFTSALCVKTTSRWIVPLPVRRRTFKTAGDFQSARETPFPLSRMGLFHRCTMTGSEENVFFFISQKRQSLSGPQIPRESSCCVCVCVRVWQDKKRNEAVLGLFPNELKIVKHAFWNPFVNSLLQMCLLS